MVHRPEIAGLCRSHLVPAQAEHRHEEEARCDVDNMWLFPWDVLQLHQKIQIAKMEVRKHM